MQKNAFIVCEYDPFHNGHAHHIAQTRAAGAETVICVMSGNFVQRGAIAFADKSVRAGWAINNGADLVVETPLPYVLSGAHWFAVGAALVVKAMRTPGTLSFGSCASVEELERLNRAIMSESVSQSVRSLSGERHITYPRAMQQALAPALPAEMLSLLRDPNVVLALEYMRAFSSLTPGVDFFCVDRPSVCGHDVAVPAGKFASAGHLRTQFAEKPVAEALAYVSAYMPDTVSRELSARIADGALPLQRAVFSGVALTRLLSLDAHALRETNGVCEGLENRILKELKNCNDLQSLYDAVKTKRFTHARVRQIIVSAALGIRREDLSRSLPYLRVLGMNAAGMRFLRENKDNFLCPAVMNLSEAPQCRLRKLDADAGKLSELCRPHPRSNSGEYAVKPFVKK